MMILNGKYSNAKVFTEKIEETAISQIIELCNQPMTENSNIRIMPDVHTGAGCVIGTTMIINDKVVPNLVGVDIGCGMETVKIKEKQIDVEKLDRLIRERIPSGFNTRDIPHEYSEQITLKHLRCYKEINELKAKKSIGTLGGGNHFIEANIGSDGSIYIVIHSGSRHLGLQVANYYQNKAFESLNGSSKEDIDNLIAKLKSEGKEKQIQKEIKALINTKRTNVPKHLAYLEGELFQDYIHDMIIIQAYATLNRRVMMYEIIKGMGLNISERFVTIHNYIDTDNDSGTLILRKGAVSAQKGEKLLIPINMRDGSLICVGKGNPDWNYSAPHGAGRLMSRTQAKQEFSMEEFEDTMNGIYTTSVNQSTLDECPMAYKSIDDIVNNIGETAEIIDIIKPIYNFKAGEPLLK